MGFSFAEIVNFSIFAKNIYAMNSFLVEYEKRDSVIESVIMLLEALPHVTVKQDAVAEESHIPNRQTLQVIEKVKHGETLKFKDAEELKKYLYA
jgi:hypothetical protein